MIFRNSAFLVLNIQDCIMISGGISAWKEMKLQTPMHEYYLHELNTKELRGILVGRFLQSITQIDNDPDLVSTTDFINCVIQSIFDEPQVLGDDGIEYFLNSNNYYGLTKLLIKYFDYTEESLNNENIGTVEDCKQILFLNIHGGTRITIITTCTITTNPIFSTISTS